MKKVIAFILKIKILITCFFVLTSFAKAENFYIKNYNIEEQFTQTWLTKITRTINAFFTQASHWIIYKIPKTYNVWWNKFKVIVSNIKVQWHKFTILPDPAFYIIRIWDADKYVSWNIQYKIKYNIYWLIKKFSWYQELYHNIIWPLRNTNINSINFTLIFPKKLNFLKNNNENIFLYYWKYWDKFNLTWYIITWNIIKWYKNKLWKNEAITIWVKFPPNFFNLNDKDQANLINFNEKHTNIILEIILYLIWFLYIWYWIYLTIISRIKLKGNKMKNFVKTVEYEPPVEAYEAWILIDNSADARDISTLIYEFADKWYIKLDIEKKWFWIFKKTTITISKLKDIDPNEKKYKLDFFGNLFDYQDKRVLNWPNYDFTEIIKDSLNKLKKYVITKYYKTKHLDWFFKIRNKFIVFFTLWYFIAFIIIILWTIINIDTNQNLIPILWSLYILILIRFFSLWKPQFLNEEGQNVYKKLIWYKEFLSKVDTPRLKLLLQEDPMFFDKTLPYAIVFGMETKFIKKIDKLIKNWEIQNINTISNWLNLYYITDVVKTMQIASSYVSTTYSSSSWFSGWSSFGGWWFSGWGWWGWW